jgi:hypothetical protein
MGDGFERGREARPSTKLHHGEIEEIAVVTLAVHGEIGASVSGWPHCARVEPPDTSRPGLSATDGG